LASGGEADNLSGIDTPSMESQIFTCDLLIIDDLGTELVNSYTNSRLFHCLNNRLQNNLSTVISTNLTLQELMRTYSERIFSRISSSFKLLKLYGDDIRLLKK
ncbi:MAG: DNA replication protein DnaC, partial [Butyrivibrio sp.]